MIHRIGMAPLLLSLRPVVPSPPIEIDPGYWVQIILAVDDLVGFEQDGLLGSSRNGAHTQVQLDAAIRAAPEKCEASSNFKAGLTFVVMCGIWRAQMIGLSANGDGWFVKGASAYNAEALGWLSDFSITDLLCLAMTERDIAHMGFEMPHLNGLLAQVGETFGKREHMIPHEALPDGMLGGMIMATTNG